MRPLQGGVPERPKGTGCKPVGSAYGGSNPPAPIIIVELSEFGSKKPGADQKAKRLGREDAGPCDTMRPCVSELT
jgi:hypothetical protein